MVFCIFSVHFLHGMSDIPNYFMKLQKNEYATYNEGNIMLLIYIINLSNIWNLVNHLTIIHISHFHPLLMKNNLSLSKQYSKKPSEVKLKDLLKPLIMCSIPFI